MGMVQNLLYVVAYEFTKKLREKTSLEKVICKLKPLIEALGLSQLHSKFYAQHLLHLK